MKHFLLFLFASIFTTNVALSQDPITVANTGGNCSASIYSSDAFSQYTFFEMHNGKASYTSSNYFLCPDAPTEGDCNNYSTSSPGGHIIRWSGTRWEWLNGNYDGCFWLINACISISSNSQKVLAYNTEDSAIPPCSNWIANTAEGFDCLPTITSGCTLSVEENSFLVDIKVFPNPTNQNVTIDLNQIKKSFKANLYNSLGQILWSKEINDSSRFQFEIHQASGIYFMEILGKNGERAYIKLIKE